MKVISSQRKPWSNSSLCISRPISTPTQACASVSWITLWFSEQAVGPCDCSSFCRMHTSVFMRSSLPSRKPKRWTGMSGSQCRRYLFSIEPLNSAMSRSGSAAPTRLRFRAGRPLFISNMIRENVNSIHRFSDTAGTMFVSDKL